MDDVTLIEVETITEKIDRCQYERATALALAAIVQRLDELIAIANASTERENIAAGYVRER